MSVAPSQIIGHTDVLDFFSTCIKNKRLSHAYLLTGPESVGKTTLIRHVATTILGTGKIDTHSEWVCLDGEHVIVDGEEKEVIPVDSIREVIHRASLATIDAPYKIVVVLSAHRLNKEAANCFLKSLEDAPARTIFFLTAPHPRAVIPTIRSRMQSVRLRPVSDEGMAAALRTRGVDAERIEDMVRYAEGLPGRALRFLESSEYLEKARAPFERWEAVLKEPGALLQHLVSPIEDRDELRASIATLHTILHRETAMDARVRRRLFLASMRAFDTLYTNTTPRLVYEQLLLSCV